MGKFLAPLKKIRRLKFFYAGTIGILMLMVVGTPFGAHQWKAMTNRWFIEQEVVETLLIAVLLSAAYALSRLYQKLLRAYHEEIQRLTLSNSTLQDRLTDAFKYIGKVNVQLQEIRSAISLLTRLPESHRDFKNLLRMFAQKARTIADTDWVAVRIIDRPSLRTVIEHLEFRRERPDLHPHIPNKSIVAGEPIPGRTVIRCENDNLHITVGCIFPREEMDWEEKILLEAIAGEIELLFLVSTALNLHGSN